MNSNGNETEGKSTDWLGEAFGWLGEALREARQVDTGYALAAFAVVAVIAIIALVLAPKMEIMEFDPWQALILIAMLLVALIAFVFLAPRKTWDSTQPVDSKFPEPDIGRIIEQPTILWANTRTDVPQEILDAEFAAIENAFPDAQITKESKLFDYKMLLDLVSNNNFDIVHLDLQKRENRYIPHAGETLRFGNKSPMTIGPLMSYLEEGKVKLFVSIVNRSFILTPFLIPQMTMVASTEDMAVKDFETVVDWMGTFYKSLAEGVPVSEACNQATRLTNLPIVIIMRQSHDWVFNNSPSKVDIEDELNATHV